MNQHVKLKPAYILRIMEIVESKTYKNPFEAPYSSVTSDRGVHLFWANNEVLYWCSQLAKNNYTMLGGVDVLEWLEDYVTLRETPIRVSPKMDAARLSVLLGYSVHGKIAEQVHDALKQLRTPLGRPRLGIRSASKELIRLVCSHVQHQEYPSSKVNISGQTCGPCYVNTNRILSALKGPSVSKTVPRQIDETNETADQGSFEGLSPVERYAKDTQDLRPCYVIKGYVFLNKACARAYSGAPSVAPEQYYSLITHYAQIKGDKGVTESSRHYALLLELVERGIRVLTPQQEDQLLNVMISWKPDLMKKVEEAAKLNLALAGACRNEGNNYG